MLEPLSPTRSTHLVRVGSSIAPPVTIGGGDFVVIAGPCSIESREQFLETAQSVQASGATLLRGGIFKMRTQPSSFQGLGEAAYPIAQDIKTRLGMPLVSEITDPRQIGPMSEVVDCFQVGARSMHNYELLKELGRAGKPVLVKRGFAALIEEWVAAAEYIRRAGNPNVVLCERGIRTFEKTLRNTLDLGAVAWAKANTDLPVVVDPSHGTGIRELIGPMSLAAAAVGADGLLIEVHPRPSEALSDGPQALTPPDFAQLMQNLERVLAATGRRLHPTPGRTSVALTRGDLESLGWRGGELPARTRREHVESTYAE